MIDIVVRGVRYNAHTEDIAEMLGLTRTYVLNLAQQEKIPSIKLGTRRRYNRQAVTDAWVALVEQRAAQTEQRTEQQENEVDSGTNWGNGSDDIDIDIDWGDGEAEDASFDDGADFILDV